MPVVQFPLGGMSKDIKSRKSRADCFNGFLEFDNRGDFRRIKRSQGFELFQEIGVGPIRGTAFIGGQLYVASGPEFYRLQRTIQGTFVPFLLGSIAGQGSEVRINSIGTDNQQIMVIAVRKGFLYDTLANTFVEVTDLDFSPDVSVASLNQRFFFNKPNSNELFASEILDGTSYNPLTFASAETSPDAIQYIVSLNTGLYVMGTTSIERWQSINVADPVVIPVQVLRGANIERGVLSPQSVQQFQNSIFWLADDLTVRSIVDGQYSINPISDLDFHEDIQTYRNPELVQSFIIDTPESKNYVITFPNDDVTWSYDLETQFWHKRKSFNMGRWRIASFTNAFDRFIVGDFSSGKLYEILPDVFNENGETQEIIITTPPIYDDQADLFINFIELVVDVGQGRISDEIPSLGIRKGFPISPLLRIEYSTDGGRNFRERAPISLGAIGDSQKKVISRTYGRLKRHFNMVWRFTITDDVDVNFYSLWGDVNRGMD